MRGPGIKAQNRQDLFPGETSQGPGLAKFRRSSGRRPAGRKNKRAMPAQVCVIHCPARVPPVRPSPSAVPGAAQAYAWAPPANHRRPWPIPRKMEQLPITRDYSNRLHRCGLRSPASAKRKTASYIIRCYRKLPRNPEAYASHSHPKVHKSKAQLYRQGYLSGQLRRSADCIAARRHRQQVLGPGPVLGDQAPGLRGRVATC